MKKTLSGLIDKAILIACPCNYTNWNEDRGRGLMTINTDPSFQMEKIDKKTEIVLIVGKSDKNTKPYLSEKYAAYAKELGLNVKLNVISGEHIWNKIKPGYKIIKEALK